MSRSQKKPPKSTEKGGDDSIADLGLKKMWRGESFDLGLGRGKMTEDGKMRRWGKSKIEEIVYQYPVLNLVDVYAVITYYLRNKDIVEKYLKNRTLLAEQFKQQNQKNKNIRGLPRRKADLNIARIQDVGLSGKDDATVLE